MTAQQQGSNNCPSSRQRGAGKENSPLRPVASGANNLSRKAYRRCCCCFCNFDYILLSFTNRPNPLQMTPILPLSAPETCQEPSQGHARGDGLHRYGAGSPEVGHPGRRAFRGELRSSLYGSPLQTLFFFFFGGGCVLGLGIAVRLNGFGSTVFRTV